MKYGCVLLLITAIGLSSCQWGVPHNSKPAVTKDTLVYTYKTVKQQATDCSNKSDSTCTTAEIKYAVFAGQRKLNDTITQRLLRSYRVADKPDTGLQQQADNFIKAYESDTLGKVDHPGAAYSLESSASVIRQDSSLVTIEISTYAFAGGAHGSERITFINWNTKRNAIIALNDIFADGYKPKLTAVAEKIFRAEEKLTDTSSLENYFFKDAKFALNNNFLITPVGIRFLYNDYEIKPYSDGPTELLIPYAQIKSLLRPNTVVSQYHK